MLQELSDEISSNGDTDSGYSVAVIMDPWTFPISDEARAQGIRIPVRAAEQSMFHRGDVEKGCYWVFGADHRCYCVVGALAEI